MDETIHLLGTVQASSVWQVQLGGCVDETLTTGSKWRSQLIVCCCSSVAWGPDTMKRNVRIENPIFWPNSVWTTLSLFEAKRKLLAYDWDLSGFNFQAYFSCYYRRITHCERTNALRINHALREKYYTIRFLNKLYNWNFTKKARLLTSEQFDRIRDWE